MDVGTCDPRPGRLRYTMHGALAVCVVLLLGASLNDYFFSPQEFNPAPSHAIVLMDNDNARVSQNATAAVVANVLTGIARLQEEAATPGPNQQYACDGLKHARAMLKD